MHHTIGATRRFTFSRRAFSRGQGAMGKASQIRTQRAARVSLTAPFEGVIEGGVDGGGVRRRTVKDANSP
jgi:hypothetical protein